MYVDTIKGNVSKTAVTVFSVGDGWKWGEHTLLNPYCIDFAYNGACMGCGFKESAR